VAKYDPLIRYLLDETEPAAVLTFPEIETILGSSLPKSARTYREWWGNEKPGGSHVQSQAWQAAGCSVDNVDFVRERVTFRRV
jgi:hypothetical protein